MVTSVTVNNTWRDYVTDGVPGSGDNEPDKADIRALLSRIETMAGVGSVAKATKAQLDAITDKDDATPGFVLADSTAANNGQYAWDDTGGSWVKLRALPDTAAVLQSVSGTNTITASVGTGVDPAVVSIFVLTAAATNTGAVTLNISGGGAQDLVDRNGDALVSGSLVSGRAYLVFDDGSDYRLLNDDDRILPYQGAYAAPTTYSLGDLAENGGSIWYSLQDNNTGNTPSEGAYWTQFLAGSSVADGAVTNVKLAADAVTSDKILDGTISTNDIADDAVTAAKIADDAVNAVIATRGDEPRQLIQIIRDTPPSISDYGGVGDGTTNDRDAIRNCLDEYGICYLPYFKPGTYTAATWYFATEITLSGDMQVIGDPRLPKVKQGAGDNLFVFTNNYNRLENVLIDPSNQSVRDISETTIVFNTASASVEKTVIKGIQWGLDRDRSTVLPGYDFFADTPHASNTVVGLDISDVEVWGAKGYPFYAQRFFADIYHKNVLIDWTRQAHVPTYPGFTLTAGEGVFYEECTVQGVGTTGTGNAASHGWSVSNASAVGFRRTRADVCGGNGYYLSSVVGAEMTHPIGSLCGEEQFLLSSVTKSQIISPYAGGRSGLGWAPTLKAGIKVSGGKPNISDPICIANTGSGLEIASANALIIAGGQYDSNVRYGVEESGTSNYNGFVASTFSANTINNGYMAGAASFHGDSMLNSGASVDHATPGAATAW